MDKAVGMSPAVLLYDYLCPLLHSTMLRLVVFEEITLFGNIDTIQPL